MTEFATEHPFFTLLILYGVYQLGWALCFRIPNRWLRGRNIRAKGWPPPHCDADGDFKP